MGKACKSYGLSQVKLSLRAYVLGYVGMQTKIEVLRVPRSLQLYQNMSPTRYEGPEIYLTLPPKDLKPFYLRRSLL